MKLKSRIMIGIVAFALGIVNIGFEVCAIGSRYIDWVSACGGLCDSSESELFFAVREGMEEDFKRIIAEGARLNCTNSRGETVLNEAARLGRLEMVKYLIEVCHVDPLSKNIFDDTALHKAALYGQLDIIKYLIEKCSVDPNLKNKSGETALHKAAIAGKLDVVKYLVEDCHVDLNLLSENNDTPLHYATWGKAYEVMKYLISKQATMVNDKNKNEDTPAHCTLGFLDSKYIMLLIAHGADLDVPNEQGLTVRRVVLKSVE